MGKWDGILDRIKENDSSALAEVFHSANAYCIRTLRKKTSCDKEDAEDLFMDAILVFRENVLSSKLDQISNLNSYVYGICWNLWRERNRNQKKWAAAQDEITHQLLLMSEQGGIPFAEEELMEKQQTINLVTRALTELGEKCQQLLRMVYIEKRSHQEIASILEFSSSNVVKVTRHRCYQQWMKKVNEHA